MYSDTDCIMEPFSYEEIDALENSCPRTPSPVTNSMNLDLEGVFRESNAPPTEEPENTLVPCAIPLRPVREEPAAKTPCSGTPRIRIRREEKVRAPVVGREKTPAAPSSASTAKAKNGPRFVMKHGSPDKRPRDKFKRETLNIQLLVGLALWNSGGEPIGPSRIYDFFTTHFVKYTTGENKYSWKNTIRTKLTFADKFTRIVPSDGAKTRGKYTLNLSNGNWVVEELNLLERDDLFAGSGLVKPNVWESMKRGLLGLPPKSWPSPRSTTRRDAQAVPANFRDTRACPVIPPVRRPAATPQFERNVPSFEEFKNGLIGVPPASAPRRINMGPSTSQQRRPTPYPAQCSQQTPRRPMVQIQNQQSNLRHHRAAFSLALQNSANQLSRNRGTMLQQRIVQQFQQTSPSEKRDVIYMAPHDPLIKPIPDLQDVENMPIDEFDAARIFGFC